MSYFVKNNYIKYDEWFDENISPLDLNFYYEEKQFSNTLHEKFYLLSTSKIFISGSKKYLIYHIFLNNSPNRNYRKKVNA